MNWTNFVTYGDSYQQAFETLGDQLFERYLRRSHKSDLVKFRVINGAGGDGGIEAYGELKNGDIVAIQAKWFRDVIEDSQIGQIRKSITTAMTLRPNIKQYIICVPRSIGSLKFGRGAKGAGPKPIFNTEEKKIDMLTDEMEILYPDLKISWWFEQEIELEIQNSENEGIHKFWFEREIISFQHLINQFNMQKSGWLFSRYIPELHGRGIIDKGIQELLYNVHFRDQLCHKMETNTSSLVSAGTLATKFLVTLDDASSLHVDLSDINRWIEYALKKFAQMSSAVMAGEDDLNLIPLNQPKVERPVFDKLMAIDPSNTQMGIRDRLVDALNKINEINLDSIAEEFQFETRQKGRLFLGDAGTGKTHGLTNAVETQLAKTSPAIIIRAKGTPCANWSVILAHALELIGWDKEQVLSALETLALRNDHRLAALAAPRKESNLVPTKVIICIDGLEEDTSHWQDWYERIREGLQLMERFSRLKLIFSARTYYLDSPQLPKSATFKIIHLPREGDVPVYEVMESYFSKEHFNISVEPKLLIRGLDSLLALRLFCEENQDKTLTDTDEIITSEKTLLNKKVRRMNTEFLSSFEEQRRGRTPVRDAMELIADYFYNATEIEHDDLFALLKPLIGDYLNASELDRLIQYLADNGLLTKKEIPDDPKMLGKVKLIYQLPYQSIMELVMADKFATAIANNKLSRLPNHILEVMESKGELKSEGSVGVNQRILQNLTSTLFLEHGKLIGEDDFLLEGLENQQVLQLKMSTLSKAPAGIATKYGPSIETNFFEHYKTRHFIFRDLIFPAATSSFNYFGSEFLHELLMKQPNAYSREKNWLGWDGYSISKLGEEEAKRFHLFDLKNIIDPNDNEHLTLSPYSLHNEQPLIYGWALSTLDQTFRHKLRVALMAWALKQPFEFILLVDKLFECKDPQVQEDLASITLGFAGKLKNKEAIGKLANWSLDNVFNDIEKNRNVIVRQGFRAVVERAVQYGLISNAQAELARPRILTPVYLLALDKDVLSIPRAEIYPIVHDLAWYVIKDSYNDFVEFTRDKSGGLLTARQQLLVDYATKERIDSLGTHTWAMAAAIAYIKNLGFDRETGNPFTRATHGSKSDIFTLEEKYTWLAVHYLKGYLSDYLPLRGGDYVQDYSEIVEIPNPVEFLMSEESQTLLSKSEWVIQDNLVSEMHDISDLDEAIRLSVEGEPTLNMEKWLRFNSQDFTIGTNGKKLLALYNYTSLHDSKKYVTSRIDIRACLVKKGQSPILRDLIMELGDESWFVQDIDRMHSNPKTDVYSNPSDLIWMNWIGETEDSESYHLEPSKEEKLYYAVTSVTNKTINGESEIKIPSKIVRGLLGIVEMNGQFFINNQDEHICLNHQVTGEDYVRQEMTLVREEDFLNVLDKNGFEIVWFIELLSKKNALNDEIIGGDHPQKCRKYFVSLDKNEFQSSKYWDARFSNK